MSVLDANVHKTPLAQSLPRAMSGKAADAVEELGKVLPCKVVSVVSPWVVTVGLDVQYDQGALPQITVPVLAPPYIAYPVAVGDAGLFVSADLRLAALSGIGSGGVPGLYDTPGNLSAGTFVWLGNKSWTTPDPAALVLWGNVVVTQAQLAFFGGAKASKQTISGPLSSVADAAAKTVLTSIINALAAYGLVTNGTT